MQPSLAATEPNRRLCTNCPVRRHSVCGSLDEAQTQAFEHLGRHIHFAPCETVFPEEEMATSFYTLLAGVIRFYKLLPDGRRQIVGFALPGDFFGMTASGRNNFSAEAIDSVVVCRFSRASFLRFADDKPNLLRRINELAILELSQAWDHMVLLGRRSAEEKVATFMISWRNRLSRQSRPLTTLPLPMGRQDIADYLGLTIETVSRTLTKLERDGLIEIVPGGVYLPDPARAEALAEA